VRQGAGSALLPNGRAVRSASDVVFPCTRAPACAGGTVTAVVGPPPQAAVAAATSGPLQYRQFAPRPRHASPTPSQSGAVVEQAAPSWISAPSVGRSSASASGGRPRRGSQTKSPRAVQQRPAPCVGVPRSASVPRGVVAAASASSSNLAASAAAILPSAAACGQPRDAWTIAVPPASAAAPSAAPVMSAAMLAGPLSPGQDVKVADQRFRVQELLSQGSFGDVWIAQPLGCTQASGSIVIKEIFCRHRAGLRAAEFEGEILRLCGGFRAPAEGAEHAAAAGEGDEGAIEGRVPVLLAQDTTCVGQEIWRVRLAMAKVPGEPLDDYLDRRQQQRRLCGKSVAASDAAPLFAEALEFAEALLLQLSSAMERVSEHVFHRDIHSRNMLVEEAPGQPPRFGLVDFGLAVDAGKWRAGGWRECGAAGDCRCWPVSAWLYFAEGIEEVLDEHPLLRAEYEERLDLHSAALTAIEAFAKLSPSLPADLDASSCSMLTTGGGAAPMLRALGRLTAAWEEYWRHASRFWSVVFGAFANGGDIMELKSACIEVGVHSTVQSALLGLRTALQEAKGAFLAEPRGGDKACTTFDNADMMAELGLLHSAPAVFDALSAMLSCGEEQTEPVPSWAQVRKTLSQGKAAAAAARRMPSSPPSPCLSPEPAPEPSGGASAIGTAAGGVLGMSCGHGADKVSLPVGPLEAPLVAGDAASQEPQEESSLQPAVSEKVQLELAALRERVSVLEERAVTAEAAVAAAQAATAAAAASAPVAPPGQVPQKRIGPAAPPATGAVMHMVSSPSGPQLACARRGAATSPPPALRQVGTQAVPPPALGVYPPWPLARSSFGPTTVIVSAPPPPSRIGGVWRRAPAGAASNSSVVLPAASPPSPAAARTGPALVPSMHPVAA